GTLDSYCKRNGVKEIDILKIDVQGADSLLKNGAIRLIYSEVLFAENYSGQSSLLSISAFLEKHSYLLWDFKSFSLYEGRAVMDSKRDFRIRVHLQNTGELS